MNRDAREIGALPQTPLESLVLPGPTPRTTTPNTVPLPLMPGVLLLESMAQTSAGSRPSSCSGPGVNGVR